MKRLLLIVVVLMAVSLVLTPMVCLGAEKRNIVRPDFIEKRIDAFKYWFDDRPDWARMLGWGKGFYKRYGQVNSFLWFSWSDNNGYLQFDIDVLFPEDHLQEIRFAKYPYPINKPRWWQAEFLKQQDITWVNTGKGLFNVYCQRRTGKCDTKQILDKTISIFARLSFIIDMRVVEYLDKD